MCAVRVQKFANVHMNVGGRGKRCPHVHILAQVHTADGTRGRVQSGSKQAYGQDAWIHGKDVHFQRTGWPLLVAGARGLRTYATGIIIN